MNKKLIILALSILIVGGIVLGIWAISSSSNNKPQPAPATTQNQSVKSNEQAKTPSTDKNYPVMVYFSKHPDSDNDPAKTFPVNRISSDLGVANFAINQLLVGPTAAEKGQGYFSTVRLRAGTATADFKLTINNGTATLEFLKPFDHLGVVADGQADSEIKATLKQFTTVSKVIILNYQGNCEFDLSGQNLCKQ